MTRPAPMRNTVTDKQASQVPKGIPLLFKFPNDLKLLGCLKYFGQPRQRIQPLFVVRMMAVTYSKHPEVVTRPNGDLNYRAILSWERICIQELPLYVGWAHTWPLLGKFILGNLSWDPEISTYNIIG